MTRDIVLFIQDLDAFQGAKHSHISIVIAAMRNRIKVGPEQDDRKVRIAPFPAANDVSRRIDSDLQSLPFPSRLLCICDPRRRHR
jgi:hypothetical protein